MTLSVNPTTPAAAAARPAQAPAAPELLPPPAAALGAPTLSPPPTAGNPLSAPPTPANLETIQIPDPDQLANGSTYGSGASTTGTRTTRKG